MPSRIFQKLFTGFRVWGLELFVKWAAMLFQGLQVTLGVIATVMFPAGIIDANEFVGQRPASLVVFALVPRFVGAIIFAGPRRLFEGAAGIFVKGLPAEFGTAAAQVRGFGVAALFDDRCQPIKLGHFVGAGEAAALGAEGDQQARG